LPQALLRSVVVLHAVALFAQAGLAGEFLSGTDRVVKFHEIAGWIIPAICLVQIALGAIAMRSGIASWWLLIGSVFVFLAEALQTGSGYGRFLRVHVPLGVVLFGAVMWQVISVFRKSSRTEDCSSSILSQHTTG